jgi:hypothetical protein
MFRNNNEQILQYQNRQIDVSIFLEGTIASWQPKMERPMVASKK